MGVQMRGTRALLAAVIVMGVMIVVGTAILISVVVSRATHGTLVAGVSSARTSVAGVPESSSLRLGQPPGTRILSITRQTDTLLAIALTGGGSADRVLIWDTAAGRVVAWLTLDR